MGALIQIRIRILAGLAALVLSAAPVLARDHAVAAQGSKASGGFPSVQAALNSGALSAGDRLVLADGAHGALWIGGQAFDPPLEIVAKTPGKAQFDRIRVEKSSGITFRGLSVWPKAPPDRPRPLVSTAASARDITFIEMDIRGRKDAPRSYFEWTVKDWTKTWRSSGVELAGKGDRLLRSKITGIAFAITLRGPGTRAEGNQVRGFSGDGIRILGNRSAAIGNRIENCFDVDANHDDGIQSWAPKAQPVASRRVSQIVLDSNTIIEWSARKPHPLRCSLQGIGFFDGMFDQVVIRNNLVVVGNYHGISLYGARRSRIVNNTIVHIDRVGLQSPAIRLMNHKKGYASKANVVANNIAAGYINKSADQTAIDRRNNAIVQYPARVFRDPADLDFRPKTSSGLVDAGDARHAPKRDITGSSRPKGRAPDLGAYEQR